MKRLLIRYGAVAFVPVVLMGCNNLPTKLTHTPEFAPVYPVADQKSGVPTGAIYNGRGSDMWFGKGRAYAVGDLITVLLNESTQANRQQTGDYKRKDSNDVLPSKWSDKAGVNLNASNITSSGSGAADQTASLTGSIAVTVVEVLARTSPWLIALFSVLLGLGLLDRGAQGGQPGRDVAPQVHAVGADQRIAFDLQAVGQPQRHGARARLDGRDPGVPDLLRADPRGRVGEDGPPDPFGTAHGEPEGGDPAERQAADVGGPAAVAEAVQHVQGVAPEPLQQRAPPGVLAGQRLGDIKPPVLGLTDASGRARPGLATDDLSHRSSTVSLPTSLVLGSSTSIGAPSTLPPFAFTTIWKPSRMSVPSARLRPPP